jgi:molybdate transport system substrate-binding protein
MANEAAQLNVLISGGFAGAYEQLLPEFQRMSGIKVTTGSGASQGSGPQTIAVQLGRGVAADVVILSREGLSELIAAKMIAAGTDVDLARVRLRVAVRARTRKPDHGKGQHQVDTAGHGRNRDGRRRERGSCNLACQ